MPHPMFKKKSISELVEASSGERSLKKVLKSYQLIIMGIGAIIGTGIFVISRNAAECSGPALPLSFIVAGIVCVFAALCYAEFAAMIPVTGSAYTYSYAAFGEIWAWIMGWVLILEYSVAVGVVAIGGSLYLSPLLEFFGLSFPQNYLHSPFDATPGLMNLPAVIIILAIVALLIFGTQESARITTIVVAIKLAVLGIFVALCLGHFNPSVNWVNFIPYGTQGIIGGAGIVILAFIGFDSVVLAAEETDDPKKNIPIAVIGSLIACIIVYVLVAAMLTGTVTHSTLIGYNAPLSEILTSFGYPWGSALIAFGAISAITTVILVNIYSQSRIFFAMSRDGLLPEKMGRLHPKFGTPVNSILLIGIVTALLAAFAPIKYLANLVSMGALASFMIVAFGIIYLRYTDPDLERPFKVPLFPLIPILSLITSAALLLGMGSDEVAYFGVIRPSHLYFILWMLIGVILYFLFPCRRHKRSEITQ